MNTFEKTNLHLLGVDVSAYQADIDWQRVKRTSVKFAFIKATEGATFVDKHYARNIKAARAAEIPCGAYHFLRPKTSIDDQVRNFVRTVGALQKGDLQPVLDIEVPADWAGIPHDTRIALILAWLSGVETALGVQPIIYLSASFAGDVLAHAKELSVYPLWVAHYTKAPKPSVPLPWQTWTFWQHSDKGVIDGIASPVDLDWFNGNLNQLELFRRH